MHIKQKKLRAAVEIIGVNFLNQKASITFSPYEKPGWWWKVGDEIIPIDWRVARYRKGRLQLFYKKFRLNVWEHIGVLRFLGLDHVLICSDAWSPYYMGSEYFSRLSPYLYETGNTIPLVRFHQKGEYASMNRLLSCVSVAPHVTEDLHLEVISQWEDLPLDRRDITFSELSNNEGLLEKVLSSKPQGLSGRKVSAKILRALGLWGHLNSVAWKSDFPSKQDAAVSWGYHRLQDFLGELSLISNMMLPTGKAFSYMAGHKESLLAIKNSFS